MNKYIKVFSICALMVFSFYYTEKIALYAQNNTPLKKEIIAFKENNKIPSVNAIINGKYITPGLDGREINVDKSYENMKLLNTFNENELVYKNVHPEISLLNYPDKIINSGNLNKKAISIIVNNELDVENYLEKNNIDYSSVNNNSYCIVTKTECKDNIRKVKPSIILNNSNFLKNVNLIKNGDIILIEDNLPEKYLYVLLKEINYSGLKILNINEHLSENNYI